MRASPARLGGGAQYPYPKEVWSPAGGWWSRPANWKSNTAIAAGALAFTIYGLWTFSAEREVRTVQPTRWIPSMLWSKQAREIGIKDEGYRPDSGHGHH
ncbi:hypothetical protein P389DRAFT_39043 [Cystobasidium minutum MCA 4210]|uniref:uncharacterized protein n=1 Tax=Cystobasidium minutum MCA 4210 TaxID=1397322 RepID=UPI0034CEBC66|eukprot:jgi/Rhomi1/39043/CE39042_2503